MDSPLTPKCKGSNQECYLDDSTSVIIPLDQKFRPFRSGQRKRWREGYCWRCVCILGFVLIIGVFVGLVVHNLVTLNGIQEKLEKKLKAKLTEDILEEVEISFSADVEKVVEKLVKKEEKRILELLDKKLQKEHEEHGQRKHGEKLMDQDREFLDIEAEETGAAEERRLKLLEENVQGRMEEGLKQLDERLSALVDEKVRAALLVHPGLDQILKSTQVDMQEKSPFKRRNRRNASQLAYVHLHGRSSGHIYDSDIPRNFIWDRRITPHGNGFSYVYDFNTGAVSKVKIKTRGIYLVYSQIAVHGNNNSLAIPFECAQETVQHIHSTDTDNVLLKSLLTQYNLGASITEASDGHLIYALDTKLQMGIFALSQNDLLKVRYSENCGNFNYMMRPEYSYFGVLKLA